MDLIGFEVSLSILAWISPTNSGVLFLPERSERCSINDNFKRNSSVLWTILCGDYEFFSCFFIDWINGSKSTIRYLYRINILRSELSHAIHHPSNTDINWFCFYRGCFHPRIGIGLGFIYGPSIVIVGHYFKKYRGSANAFASCGSTVGQFSLAPLISYCISEYGLRGALLLHASILSHCFFFGSLVRPTDFYRRHLSPREFPSTYGKANAFSLKRNGELSDCDSATNNLISGHSKDEGAKDINRKSSIGNHTNNLKMISVTRKIGDRRNTDVCIKFIPVNTDDKSPDTSLCGSSHCITETEMPSTRRKSRAFTEYFQKTSTGADIGSLSLHIQHRIKPSYFGDSMMGFGSAVSLQDESISCTHAKVLMNIRKSSILPDDVGHTGFTKEPSKFETMSKSFKQICKSVDVSLLNQKIFVLFLLGYTFGCCGSGVMHNFFPARAEELGLSRDQGTMILAYSGCADIFARIATSLTADHPRMHRTRFVTCVLFMNAISCFNIMLFTTYLSFALFTVAYGMCCGVFFALNTTILTDFIGVTKLPQGLSMSYLVFGLCATAVYPLIGRLRDATGTYDYAFIVNGVLLFTSATLFSVESCVKKWDKKSHKNDISNT
eukprot:XP_014784900.1 PREDICTED: monocarboxylate transporter 14-like [Octopus bimaculoides]